jgi:hypothetical protein
MLAQNKITAMKNIIKVEKKKKVEFQEHPHSPKLRSIPAMEIMDGDNYVPDLISERSIDVPLSRREPDDDFLYMQKLF